MSQEQKKQTYTRIPVSEGIRKTKNWRRFIKHVLKAKQGKGLAKGVFISSADIAALGQLCAADANILGVRAYFTLESNHEEYPYVNLVKFLMVPVLDTPGYPNGQDAPFLTGGDQDSLDDSNIFDFTRPCPDCCDQTSILFGDQ